MMMEHMDRSENVYLAETEFVRFLAEYSAPAVDVIPSVQGKFHRFFERRQK